MPINPREARVGKVVYTQRGNSMGPVICNKQLPHEGEINNELFGGYSPWNRRFRSSCDGYGDKISSLLKATWGFALHCRNGEFQSLSTICCCYVLMFVKINTWGRTPLDVYLYNRATLRKFRDTAPLFMRSAECAMYESHRIDF
jgi:hypothetical protein